jgi:hypothetical protein
MTTSVMKGPLAGCASGIQDAEAAHRARPATPGRRTIPVLASS